MSFHNKGLLGGGSSPGTPITLDEEEGTRKKLRTLTSDPLSRDLGDPEFMEFKTKQFERAYPGKQKLDASGRAIDFPPVVKDIEPFKPKVKRRDLDFGAPVGNGETAKNDLSDLIGAKRGLSNTKLFEFDVTKERSDEAGKRFTDAVKRFQGTRGLKTDGLMNPEGPTVKALRGLLFPPGTASNVGQPVDLSRASAQPLATPASANAPSAQPKADTPRAALGVAPPAQPTGGGETQVAQAKTQQQPGAPIGSGIKKPSGSIAWNPIVTRLLQREGGFNSNDPSNRGVKDTTLKDHLRRKGTPPKSPQDLKRALGKLTEAEAREVYDDIIARSKVDQIPDAGLAEQVFDGVVNHGSKNGVKQLQRALIAIIGPQGANFDDGIIGPRTLAVLQVAIGQGRLRQIRDAVAKERKRFVGVDVKNTLIQRNSLKPPNLRRTQAEIIAVINALTKRAELFRP